MTARRRSTVLRTLLALLATGLVALPAADAWARSGSSFGGGFRSRGFSSRSFSRPSPSFPRSSGYRSRGFGGGGGIVPIPIPIGGGWSGGGYSTTGSVGGGLLFVVLVLGAVVVLIVISQLKARRAAHVYEQRQRLDLARVQLGVQAQARHLQDGLERMAGTVDTSSEAGLAAVLRELAIELRRNAHFIEFASVERQDALPAPRAETEFGEWSADARSKYNREVLRHDAKGGIQRTVKEVATDGIHDEDGQLAVHEFFVLTILIAARGLRLGTELHHHQDLDRVLEQLAGIHGDQLAALEVVWSPAARSDAMSREDMMLRYPQLFQV